MKLVVYISSLGCGGAERFAANLINYWAHKGWNITLITISPFSEDFYLTDPSVKRISLNKKTSSLHKSKFFYLWFNIHLILSLRRALTKVRPDVALSIMIGANVHLAIASIGVKIATVGSEQFHPPMLSSGPIWNTLRRYLYRRMGAITSLTDKTSNWLLYNTYAKKVPVISNPITWPIPLQAPILPVSLIHSFDRKLLLTVGRLETQKGFDLLIEAFNQLNKKYHDWDLVIIGEGTLRTALKNHINLLSLQKRVFLAGLAGNIADWYQSADLFVMSSRFEGFGNVLAEALSYELPVVSFDCDTGPSDIIRHGVDGLLVEAGNIKGLSLALDRLMGDSILRNEFSTRAIEARDRFSTAKISNLYEKLFQEIINS